MGDADLHEMANGRIDETGRDMTQAGRICGIVGTVPTDYSDNFHCYLWDCNSDIQTLGGIDFS
jgi:hypothetical protein